MSVGWIKLHRKILESDEWRVGSVNQRYLTMALLLLAEWQPRTRLCKRCRKDVELMPGQLLMSIRDIAAALRLTRSSVARGLEFLEKTGFLSLQISTRIHEQGHESDAETGHRCHSIITINNWENYQSDSDDEPSVGPSVGPSGEPYTIYKEIRKKKKRARARDPYPSDGGSTRKPGRKLPPHVDELNAEKKTR